MVYLWMERVIEKPENNDRALATKPRSEYHFGVSINSKQSFRMFCDIPSSSTTDDNGLRLRGCPNNRHSEPIAVYIRVFPSVYCSANSLAVTTLYQVMFNRVIRLIKHVLVTFFQYIEIQLLVPAE